MASDTVEQALQDGDYEQAQKLIALKLAHAFDKTNSARDLKALSRELKQAMDTMQQAEEAAADTPLAQIYALAEEA